MRFVLLSEKIWHIDLLENLKESTSAEWILIDRKDDFTFTKISEIKPTKIFIPHWSYMIPESIFETFECIVFHMTDLPYGRGGSPLQNLIERGHTETKISAIKVVKEVDAGPIYQKRLLTLEGSAKEIFLRANHIIKEMIVELIKVKIEPKQQLGTPVIFSRRTPDQSEISQLKSITKIYDYIRMLDCEGYPHAFLETESFRFEFTKATFHNNETIIADVRITKK